MKQHLEALQRANLFRTQRAALHRDIGAGKQSVVNVLREPIPEWLSGDTIGRLLRALPRVGAAREAEILRRAGHRTAEGRRAFESQIKPNLAIGDMTLRQRRFLADELECHYYKDQP